MQHLRWVFLHRLFLHLELLGFLVAGVAYRRYLFGNTLWRNWGWSRVFCRDFEAFYAPSQHQDSNSLSDFQPFLFCLCVLLGSDIMNYWSNCFFHLLKLHFAPVYFKRSSSFLHIFFLSILELKFYLVFRRN